MPVLRKPNENANPKAASHSDALIGARIKRYRTEAGISQTELGQASGITFQQVQKYENGQNRVSVARLAQIAATVGVPLIRFVEDLPESGPRIDRPPGVPVADQLLGTKHGLRLARGFLAIESLPVRAQLVALVCALAGGHNAPDSVH